MFRIIKRVPAIAFRFAFLALLFLGSTYLDSPVTTFFHHLVYILFGALLLIGIWFRKQKAVLLISLFLLMTIPLDFLGIADFDNTIITNGIVILLAVNTLLLGLFQEGQIRFSSFFVLGILIALQALAMFAIAYYVGSGTIVIMDHAIPFDLPSIPLGILSPEVVLIFLVCMVGSVLRELLVPQAFASLAVNLLLSLGIFHYLSASMNVPPDSLLLVWGLLTAVYIFREIYQVSYIDPLTGIPSRRALFEEASKLTGNYVVAMADIDHFKKFNDKYGHDVGDDVLAFVASVLRQHVQGVVFRYGGEEFTMLFRRSSLDDTLQHLDEVRQQVATSKFKVRRRTAKNQSNAGEVTITISIGVAEHSDQNRSFSEVLKAADKALYRAKKKGRNRVSK
ncbi:MAG: GGDEF domain-containing protein [Firmicutes bacterium]|nr:GGDEF domain-containing protein [Bacillota bacterium]